MSYEWFISLRYLKAKRKQTFISLITIISIAGVAIGVTAMIVVLAVMTGAQEDIKNKIVGANSHIVITGMTALSVAEAERTIAASLSVPGVVNASPFVFNQVIVTSSERVAGVALRGVDAESDAAVADLNQYVVEGTLRALKERFVRVQIEPDDFGTQIEVKRAAIILGNEMAGVLRVKVGDPVTVISPMGKMTALGMTPISREFYVGGMFHTGMYDYDSSLALISIRQAQTLFKMGDAVSGVEVKVEDVYRAPEIAEQIQLALGFSYTVRDWQRMNRNLFFALALEKTVIGLILILIIFVAAFNIISTMIMVTLEKNKDIAILKTMGAARWSIMKIFFYEGMTIGLVGTILGVFGGVVLCELLGRYQFIKLPSDVYNLETLPISMQLTDVAIVSAVALMITVLAALYPAWSASRVDPAESLRYE